MMTRVKICGITNLEDALAATEAGAYALGFNFYLNSPRYITPRKAREIIEQLPSSVLSVGVFVNEASPTAVARIAEEAGLAAVQLHGDETPDYCLALRHLTVIKALRVGSDFHVEQVAECGAELILLDAFVSEARGGTGKICDWSLARRARDLAPKLFLAGGLNPENVREAIYAVGPYAVDVCSGIESRPGRKIAERMRALFAAVGQCT